MNLNAEQLLWIGLSAFAAWKLYPYVTQQLKSLGGASKYPKRVEMLLALDKLRTHCESIECSEGIELIDALAPHILKHDHSKDAKTASE